MAQSAGTNFDVLIGGAGIAAAAAAIRLCALGLRPLILATRSEVLSGAEAIPEAALPLLAELELEQVLRKAHGVMVEGFENHWNADDPMVRVGRWVHVERSLLAREAVREAVERGAVLRLCRSLPKLSNQRHSIGITHEGVQLSFGAAIDATGRSAVWSRPIHRCGNQIADVFSFPLGRSPRARVARFSDGWAYRIGLEQSTTVAILAQSGKYRNTPDTAKQESLGIASDAFEYVGRRAAFPQWSESPVRRRRLAIGDAALAYDPVAGQGVRFAISSAFAAASVIQTWRDLPGKRATAERFYRNFVSQCRRSHMGFLEQLRAPDQPAKHTSDPLPEFIVFSGQTTTSELEIDSRVVVGDAILMPDRTPVRWVGGVDLLCIRDLARRPVRSSDLMGRLASAGYPPSQIVDLLHWCRRYGLIRAALNASSVGRLQLR
jgi:flavin-dependent dehydrogenase